MAIMVARSRDKIVSMFLNNGFKIIDETILEKLKIEFLENKGSFDCVSFAVLFQKI